MSSLTLHSFTFATLFALLATSFSARAAAPVTAISASDASVLTGGIGEKERIQLLDIAPQYELVASFARRSDGALLSNVDVTLSSDALKHPLEFTTNGPLLLATLPTGRYVLTARVPGWKECVRAVEVERRHNQRLYLTFVPDTDD